MAAFSFNAHEVEPMEARDNSPLPDGTYTVEVTGAELRDLKSGNGQGLSVEFTVIDPEQHARRKIWTNLNITHSNPTAEKIGRQQLAALCLACGIDHLTDTDELFQRILRVTTRIRQQEGYAPRPEVIGYASAGVPKSATPPSSPATGSKPSQPWKRAA